FVRGRASPPLRALRVALGTIDVAASLVGRAVRGTDLPLQLLKPSPQIVVLPSQPRPLLIDPACIGECLIVAARRQMALAGHLLHIRPCRPPASGSGARFVAGRLLCLAR